MEYPSHRARRRLRLFFAYGFKNSPETSSPLAAQQSAELAGRGATVGLVEARAYNTATGCADDLLLTVLVDSCRESPFDGGRLPAPTSRTLSRLPHLPLHRDQAVRGIIPTAKAV